MLSHGRPKVVVICKPCAHCEDEVTVTRLDERENCGNKASDMTQGFTSFFHVSWMRKAWISGIWISLSLL